MNDNHGETGFRNPLERKDAPAERTQGPEGR